MKNLILVTVLLCFGANVSAQVSKKKRVVNTDLYQIYVGKIYQEKSGKPKNGPIVDSVLITDISLKRKALGLLNQLQSTGDADVSKCFIPRDAIVMYKNNELVATLLICYECEGFRLTYTDDKTKVSSNQNPNYDKRLQQLKTAESITSSVVR